MSEYITNETFNEYSHRIDAENDRQNKRLANLEESVKQIQSLTISVEKMAMSVENMAKEIGKQSERLKAIEDKPADNWNKLLWLVGTALISAALGFLLRGIGL